MIDIDKIIEPYRKIQKTVESYQKLVNSVHQNLQFPLDSIKKSLEIIDYQNKIVGNSFIPKFVENFQDIGKRISENLKKTPKALMLLSEYGWYLNFESKLYLANQLGNLLKENKVDEVDQFLMEYYTENLDRILENFSTKYPDRKEIFAQIFAAHKENKYFLSITSILTQIDGICFDTTTKKYFVTEKRDKKFKYLPEVATEFVNLSGSISEAFSMPILNQTAINSHESKIGDFPVKLNRHLIMHGVDKEYGTEKNSLKCLSLLVYLSDMLTLINE